MAKTAATLRIAILGFLQRDTTTFSRTVGGTTVDLTYIAMNNARLYAERLIDFEYSRKSITIPNVTVAAGGNLANAVLYGTNTAVSVKKIVSPFLPIDSNTQQFPVDLMTKKGWSDRVKRRFEGARPTDTSDYAFITDAPFSVVQQGQTVAVVPPDTTALSSITFSLYADAIVWLADYSAGTESDFMLDYCFDWMMYRSIQELNFFLKEDQRVSLSAALVADAWKAVVQWNNELIMSSADDVVNLD